MEEFMKDFLKSSIATSIFLIILGILLVFQSEMTIMAISYVIGGILVAIGALALIRYIKKAADKESTSELDIIYGIVTIIFGVIIIQNYQALSSIIPIVLGVTIIVSSVGKLNYAFQLKADDNQLWKTTMIISIISTICGVVLLFNPFSAAIGIMKIIGIFIIVYAILDLVSTIAIKSSVTKIYDAVEETIVDAEIIEDDKKKKAQKKTNKKSKK